MPQVNPQTIETIRTGIKAAQAALELLESGAVRAEDLPKAVDVHIEVVPVTGPSDKVAEQTAQMKAARDAYVKQTETARAVSIIFEVFLKVAQVVAPTAATLLRLAPIVLLTMAAFGCAAERGAVEVGPPATNVVVGSPNQPVVKIGDGNRPLIDVEAPVTVQVGPRDANGAWLTLDARMELLKAELGWTNKQLAEVRAAAQEAGRDAKQANTAVTASGGGWAALGVILIIACAVVGIAWVRQMGKSDEYRDNAVAVAKAIHDLGPGRLRDALLGGIKADIPNRVAWDKLLDQYGLRVQRRPIGDRDLADKPAQAA